MISMRFYATATAQKIIKGLVRVSCTFDSRLRPATRDTIPHHQNPLHLAGDLRQQSWPMADHSPGAGLTTPSSGLEDKCLPVEVV